MLLSNGSRSRDVFCDWRMDMFWRGRGDEAGLSHKLRHSSRVSGGAEIRGVTTDGHVCDQLHYSVAFVVLLSSY